MGGRTVTRNRVKGVAVLSVAVGLIAASGAAGAVEPKTIYGAPDTGTGAAGEVRFPEGVGVDPISGRVALPDYSNNRVSVFAPSGVFLFAFGADVDPAGGTGPEICSSSCQKGANGYGAGAISDSEDAEFSPDGKEIFVVEARRVSVFDAAGNFKRAFGYDVIPGGSVGPEVCTIATGCQDGTFSAAGGAFSQGWPLSFGPDGLVYVADAGNSRISVHDPSGEWLRVIGQDVSTGTPGTGFEICTVTADCKVGLSGGETGSLASVEGLDFGPDQRLWSNGYSSNQIQVFAPPPALTPQGGFGKDVVAGGATGFETCAADCRAGTPGSGAGELSTPQGVAVAGDGTVYVSDNGNERISAYGSNRTFLRSFGADVVPGGTTGFEICTTATGCKAGLGNGTTGVFGPYGLAVDCRGIIYVSNSSGLDVPARAIGETALEPGPCVLDTGRLARNKRKGTAVLTMTVPYPSALELTGKNVKTASGSHAGLQGEETLKVKPTGKLAKRLRRKGKAIARVAVTMRPTEGNVAQSDSAKVELRRKKRR